MRRHLYLAIVVLAFLSFPLTDRALADDPACQGARVKISEENRRFSVLVPVSSGLGGARVYEDIGCAVIARNEECAMRQSMFDRAALAHDYRSGAEFAVEKMYFVLKTGVKTPGGSGLVAFSEKVAAETFSSRQGKGKVLKWYELVDAPF